MPCDTIQTNQIDFQKVDFAVFVDALKNAGHNVLMVNKDAQYVRFREKDSYTVMEFKKGELIAGLETEVLQKAAARLKKQYAKQVMESTAKRFGWLVKQVGVDKYEMQRRY